MEEYEALRAKQAELLASPEENLLALNAIGEEIDLLRKELKLPVEEDELIGDPDPADPVD